MAPPTPPPHHLTTLYLSLSLLLPLTVATQCPVSSYGPLRWPLANPSCALPIDDTAPSHLPTHYSPWTQPPVCETATGPSRAKYCVYANSHHGAQGMTLVTKPSTAAASLSLGALDFTPPPPNNATNAAYAIVDVPGRGKGVVATRPIKKWETFMVDYAVMMVDVEFAVDVPARRGYALLARAVEGLGDPASIRGLGMSSGMARDPVENVLRTNAFRAVVGGELHMAVYPVVSVSFSALGGGGVGLIRGRGSIMLVGRSELFCGVGGDGGWFADWR